MAYGRLNGEARNDPKRRESTPADASLTSLGEAGAGTSLSLPELSSLFSSPLPAPPFCVSAAGGGTVSLITAGSPGMNCGRSSDGLNRPPDSGDG